MPSKNPAQRLRDIVDNIDQIGVFIAGLDFDRFVSDVKTRYAVIRALEIISEASRRLPPEITARYENLDWPAIAAAGNIYRHEYEAVDEQLIWRTATLGLADLRSMAVNELARLAAGESHA